MLGNMHRNRSETSHPRTHPQTDHRHKILQNTTHKPFINIASWSKQWQTNQRPHIWELLTERIQTTDPEAHTQKHVRYNPGKTAINRSETPTDKIQSREAHSGTHTTNSSEKSHMLENTTTNPFETSNPGTYANRSDTSKPTNHTWKHRPSYRGIHPKTHRRAHVLRCTVTKILVTLTPGRAPTHRSESSTQQYTWTNGSETSSWVIQNRSETSNPATYAHNQVWHSSRWKSPQRDQRIQHFSFQSLLLLSHQFLWLYFPHLLPLLVST